MSISMNVHDMNQVLVRNFTEFVTVEFFNREDRVSFFFPDHAAVQKMIANLITAESAQQQFDPEERHIAV